MPTIAQTYEPAVSLDKLKPDPANPNEGDVGAISQSIEENGFYGAVIAAKDGTIVAGEHRWRAAAAVGETTVPVLRLKVSAAQARKILLVDNRTAELARRDDVKLAALLREMVEDAGSVDALAGTGYDGDDLDELVARMADNQPPSGFPELNENLPTQHRCPKCGFEWSGQPA